MDAGEHTVGVAFLNDFWDPDAGEDRNLVVDWFSVTGPLNAPGEASAGRQLIVPCDPVSDGEEACAETVVRGFLPRASWRPVTDAEVISILSLYDLSRASGGDWTEGVHNALKAALMSPHFLFRVELDPVDRPHPLSSWELASRLSYFLWSSMPDAELFAGRDALLAAESAQTEMALVTPGDRLDSYLWHKVSNTQSIAGGSGSAMPQGALLPQDEIDLVGDWIEGGAR